MICLACAKETCLVRSRIYGKLLADLMAVYDVRMNAAYALITARMRLRRRIGQIRVCTPALFAGVLVLVVGCHGDPDRPRTETWTPDFRAPAERLMADAVMTDAAVTDAAMITDAGTALDSAVSDSGVEVADQGMFSDGQTEADTGSTDALTANTDSGQAADSEVSADARSEPLDAIFDGATESVQADLGQ